MTKVVIAYLVSLLVSVLLISVASTQLVLADVQSFGLEVSAAVRGRATLHDIRGLALPLLMLVGLSFLVAFVVAGRAARLTRAGRTLWFLAAGLLSVPSALLGIKLAMGGTMLAAARTVPGMLVVACCGMLGGLLYAWLTRDRGAGALAGASDA